MTAIFGGLGRDEVEANYRDVVGLAEVLGGLGDVAGWLVAYLLGAFESEELAFGVSGFDYAVGDEGQAVSMLEPEGGSLLVFDVEGGCRAGGRRRVPVRGPSR